jgi:hypothetical protein
MFGIRQILETKWEYSKTAHQLFMNFQKAYDSVRREVFYNILIEFGVIMKLFEPLIMYCGETYSKVCLIISLSRMI